MIPVNVATTVSANVAQSSVQIIGTNAARRYIMFYNNGANSMYINFGQAANSSTCSVIVATFSTWVWPASQVIYTGPIFAIRNAGTGTVVVTEFTYPYST